MQVDFWGSTQEVNISLSQIGIWTMSTLMNEICSHFLTATRPSKITSLMKDWRDEIVLFAHWQVNMLSHLNAMGAIAADCVIATMRRPLDTPAFRYRVPFCQDREAAGELRCCQWHDNLSLFLNFFSFVIIVLWLSIQIDGLQFNFTKSEVCDVRFESAAY